MTECKVKDCHDEAAWVESFAMVAILSHSPSREGMCLRHAQMSFPEVDFR